MYSQDMGINFNNPRIFNREDGYGFESKENFDVLYVTMESLSKFPDNIKKIPELSRYHSVSVHNSNIKSSNSIYHKVKGSFHIPSVIINKIYSDESALLKFYYTPDTVTRYRNSVKEVRRFSDLSFLNTFPSIDVGRLDDMNLKDIYEYIIIQAKDKLFIRSSLNL